MIILYFAKLFFGQSLDAASPFDFTASIRIAQWAYGQTEKANGQVWVTDKVLQHLGPGWRKVLVA
jgi:hypothetical protein